MRAAHNNWRRPICLSRLLIVAPDQSSFILAGRPLYMDPIAERRFPAYFKYHLPGSRKPRCTRLSGIFRVASLTGEGPGSARCCRSAWPGTRTLGLATSETPESLDGTTRSIENPMRRIGGAYPTKSSALRSTGLLTAYSAGWGLDGKLGETERRRPASHRQRT